MVTALVAGLGFFCAGVAIWIIRSWLIQLEERVKVLEGKD